MPTLHISKVTQVTDLCKSHEVVRPQTFLPVNAVEVSDLKQAGPL